MIEDALFYVHLLVINFIDKKFIIGWIVEFMFNLKVLIFWLNVVLLNETLKEL